MGPAADAKNGYVTWPRFVATVMTMVLVNAGTAKWMVAAHAAEPKHAEAVHIETFRGVEKLLERRDEEFLRRLTSIDKRLERLEGK